MKKITFFPLLFAVGILFFPGCTSPPVEPAHYKIGILNISTGLNDFIVGFKEGLAENGLVEGRNVTYYYNGPIDKKDIKDQINDFKSKNIDLLYTLSTPVTKIAKIELAQSVIPIVFAPVFCPEEAGIASNKLDPERNITGVKVRGSTQKALEILVSVFPDIKKVFVPFHASDKAAQLTVDDLEEAAGKLEIQLDLVNVDTFEDLDTALKNIPSSADAVFITHSHLILSRVKQIIAAATARKIPVASSASHYKEGVLISYSVEYSSMGRQASRLALKILSGIKPGMLPIETGEYFLAVNLISADKIGAEISYDVLSQADYIIRKPLKTLD